MMRVQCTDDKESTTDLRGNRADQTNFKKVTMRSYRRESIEIRVYPWDTLLF